MKLLWPLVAWTVLGTTFTILFLIWFSLGSIVGGILEALVRKVPDYVSHLPEYFSNAVEWATSKLQNAAANPVHTICVLVGMALVLTLVRGISGAFDIEQTVFRGSKVRSAEDIFPDLEMPNSSKSSDQNEFRGSSLSDPDSLFNSSKVPVWGRLWQAIKNLATRTSDGDDLH